MLERHVAATLSRLESRSHKKPAHKPSASLEVITPANPGSCPGQAQESGQFTTACKYFGFRLKDCQNDRKQHFQTYQDLINLLKK
jgi:hypothetical protein